jgi:hypothetical protein
MITYVANHDDLCMNDGHQKLSQPKIFQSLDTLQRASRNTRLLLHVQTTIYVHWSGIRHTPRPAKNLASSSLQSGTGVIDRWSALDAFPRRGAGGQGLAGMKDVA